MKDYRTELSHEVYDFGSHGMKDINSLFQVFQEVIVRITETFARDKTVHEKKKKNRSGSRIPSKMYELKEIVFTGNGAKAYVTIKNVLSSASVGLSLRNKMQWP